MPRLEQNQLDRLKENISDYMARHGINLNPNKNINCIMANHEDKTASMSFKHAGNYLHCFGCKAHLDIFSACEELEGLQKGQGINRIAEIYGLRQPQDKMSQYSNSSFNSQAIKPQEPAQDRKITSTPKETDFTDFINDSSAKLGTNDYHTQRGISEEVARRFKLGYANNKQGIRTALVIPIKRDNGTYSYQLRNTDPYAEDKDKHRKPSADIAGEAGLFNLEAISNPQDITKPLFVVEGAIDSISLAEANAEAVALNGATNVRKLIDAIKRYKVQRPIVLALDNDKTGRKATEEIKAELITLKKAVYSVNVSGKCKDPNEALLSNTDAFKGFIARLDNAQTIAKVEYDQNTIEKDLNSFLDFVNNKRPPAISTGFKMLDDTLRGGLREGLICIGGISSLGKTTLALQMMDNIAKQGRDVLIFSLEMGSHELRAKSIAKESFLLSVANTGFSQESLTTLEVLDKQLREQIPLQNRAVLQDAFKAYMQYARRIYIHEAVGKFTVNDVKTKVQEHIKATGNTPVVLLDYLQILQPAENGLSDKGKVSYDVLMLKQLSRDYHTPVVVISSFNRDSYDKEASFSSFKESGEIEYSADVLMALQLTAVRTGQDAHEALQDNPREIDVKFLKNRNGTLGIVSFNATLSYNCFEEMTADEIKSVTIRAKQSKEKGDLKKKY